MNNIVPLMFMNYMGIGMAICFLVIFVLIVKHGVVGFCERRKYVLWFEIGLMLGLIGLGTYNAISWF